MAAISGERQVPDRLVLDDHCRVTRCLHRDARMGRNPRWITEACHRQYSWTSQLPASNQTRRRTRKLVGMGANIARYETTDAGSLPSAQPRCGRSLSAVAG